MSYLVVELAVIAWSAMWDMKSKSRTDMYIKESIVAVKVRVQTNEEHIQASNNECRPHESKDGMLTCSPVDRDVARQCSCAIFIHRRYKMPFQRVFEECKLT